MKKAFLLFSLFSYLIFAKETDITTETLHLFEYHEALSYIAKSIDDKDTLTQLLTQLLKFDEISEDLTELFITSFETSFQGCLKIIIEELKYVLKQNRDDFASVSIYQDHLFDTQKNFKNFNENSKELYTYLQKLLLIINRIDTSIEIKSSLDKAPKLLSRQLVRTRYMFKLLVNEIGKIKDKLILDNNSPLSNT
jgi:hypothetical protein